MNKQVKKKLELQLQTAIESILVKQDSKAAAKSRKTIKQSSKAVVKKFNKAMKSLEEKKEPVKKKRILSKAKISSTKSHLKNITGETAKIRRSYAKEPAAPVAKAPQTIIAERPGTESL